VTADLLAASPRVTPAANEPGVWWVGASGFDGLGGESSLAHALLEIARTWHPRARVAVADSCVAARAATWASRRGAHDVVIIPSGGDAHYLAPAPLALIPMDDELRETFAALGLRTVGDIAALDAEDVERRWGAEGLAVWQLARGEDERRPVLATPPQRRVVEAELPSPVEPMEPVLFLVHASLDRLVTGLATDGRAAAAIAITLTLDGARSALPRGVGAHTVTREVRLPRPVARATHLFEHCRALLERWPLESPMAGVAVAITATAPAAGEQGDLLAPSWREHSAVDAALARLRAELGADVVVRPTARDEHRPDQAGAWVEIARADDAVDGSAGTEAGGTTAMLVVDARHLALRLLEMPEPIEVERSAGAPCGMWWRECRSVIVRATGPERLSGHWWKEDAYHRDYWRCEGEMGEFLIFLDRDTGAWYLHGWYD
jgi:protein ImuB